MMDPEHVKFQEKAFTEFGYALFGQFLLSSAETELSGETTKIGDVS